MLDQPPLPLPTPSSQQETKLESKYEEVQRQLREQGIRDSEKKEGLLKRVWMGGESDDWKVRRIREKRVGYSGLIANYFRDAFGMLTKKGDGEGEDKGIEAGEKDKEVKR